MLACFGFFKLHKRNVDFEQILVDGVHGRELQSLCVRAAHLCEDSPGISELHADQRSPVEIRMVFKLWVFGYV